MQKFEADSEILLAEAIAMGLLREPQRDPILRILVREYSESSKP